MNKTLLHRSTVSEDLDRLKIDSVVSHDHNALLHRCLDQGNGFLHEISHAEGLKLQLLIADLSADDCHQITHHLCEPTGFVLHDQQLIALIVSEVVASTQQTAGVSTNQGDGRAQLMTHAAGELPLALQ